MSAAPANAPSVILTPEQQRALGVPGSSVALSAGAGCGKTTVLTERFLSALEDGTGRPLKALAALTFTEKAARELRQRIRARCRERLAAGDPSGWWSAVLRGLDAAPIGTFHEFCARLLRRHHLLAGVDPEFAILDESIAGSLREQAVRVALRHLLAARDADLIELGTEFGLRQVREALGRLAASRGAVELDDWARLSPEEIVGRWRDLAECKIWPLARDGAAALVARCRDVLEWLDSDVPKIAERAAAVLAAMRVLDAGAPPCPASWIEDLVGLLRVQDLPRASSWPSPEGYEAVKVAFGDLREHLRKHIIPALEWSDDGVLLATAERSLRFARLAVAVRGEFERLKRQRGGLDFDDLLVKARDLLRDHPDLVGSSDDGIPRDETDPERSRRALDIEFVLVDEFQDTDGIQGEVLRLLSGAGFLSGRLFLVGDVKQSIYRFRGAEPGIFRDWRAEFPAPGRLSLTENFRSVPGVIGFVNALFGDCFRDLEPVVLAEDGSSFDPPFDQRLRPVRRGDICQPAVEFLWPEPASAAESDDDAGGNPAVKISARERRVIEARSIARRLRERLDEGWPIHDRATRTIRPAHPGDVALLFRAMTDLWPYESALADEGFEYHTVGGSAFYAQQEVHDVINLLSVVEDPFDEIALAGALRSPFFGVSDEGLFRLATAPGDGGLTGGLRRLGDVPGLSSLDRARIERASALLQRWRADKDRIPMARLVARVLDESGFEGALVCEFLGERKLANSRKIVRLAREYDRQGGFTLADFVARLRAYLEEEPREEQAATTDEEGASVRLMSIHRAKGLEFPIVVLPDLGRTSRTPSPLVACRPDLGLVVRPPLGAPPSGDDSSSDSAAQDPVWRAYLALERAEDEQESLRLFYVAATRARDALILSAGIGPDEPTPSGSVALRLLDDRFDRRTGACRVAPLPDDPAPPPSVQVRLMPPPDPAGMEPAAAADAPPPAQAAARPARLSITAIAEMISRASPAPAEEPVRAVTPPLYMDVDPSAELSPREARLDALVRSVIGEPRWRLPEPPSLESLASEVGERQVPAASPGLIRDAILRLDALWDLPAFRALRSATSSGDSQVLEDIEFTLELSGTVYHGSADLAFRDQSGRWNLVVIADDRTSPARQRLRLELAARAARELRLEVLAGWVVWHGSDGASCDGPVTQLTSTMPSQPKHS